MLSLCTWIDWHLSSPCQALGGPLLLRFVAVQVFEGFQFLDERFVLVLQHGHAVLQTFDVLLLLPATLARRLPVWHRERVSERVCWVSLALFLVVFFKLRETFKNTLYLFFMSRTSLLRVTSSVPPPVPSDGEVAITTPGVMALVAAVRI